MEVRSGPIKVNYDHIIKIVPCKYILLYKLSEMRKLLLK